MKFHHSQLFVSVFFIFCLFHFYVFVSHKAITDEFHYHYYYRIINLSNIIKRTRAQLLSFIAALVSYICPGIPFHPSQSRFAIAFVPTTTNHNNSFNFEYLSQFLEIVAILYYITTASCHQLDSLLHSTFIYFGT